MSDTFCVLPWTHLIITPDGTPSACNWMGTRRISRGGAPLSVYRHSLDEIWNSDEMRGLRRDLVHGNRAAACAECYKLEDAGGCSLRMQMNQHWREGFVNPEGRTAQMLQSLAVVNDYRLPTPPGYIELDLGNQCNLKCRSCAGGSSSRIARDPTHNKWAGESEDLTPPAQVWFRQKEIIRELLQAPEHLRHIHLIGGEPFLVKEVGDILQTLIDAGAAPHISLSCHTNGTTVNTPWLRLTERFAAFSIWVSMDGYGPYFEYTRYPAKWRRVVENLEQLRKLPNADVRGFVVYQVYNALNVVELLRFFDEIGLPFLVYLLFEPLYLRAASLPPEARRLAVARLRAYQEKDCRPENRWIIDTLTAELEHPGEACDVNHLLTLMLFTNDLDVTRGQSFRETHGELLDLINASGVAWREQTHHAPRQALPVLHN